MFRDLVILRDEETTLKIMGKNIKMETRKWVEAVYDDVAGVLRRTPYMTKLKVQAVLDIVKSPGAHKRTLKRSTPIRSCRKRKRAAFNSLCVR